MLMSRLRFRLRFREVEVQVQVQAEVQAEVQVEVQDEFSIISVVFDCSRSLQLLCPNKYMCYHDSGLISQFHSPLSKTLIKCTAM